MNYLRTSVNEPKATLLKIKSFSREGRNEREKSEIIFLSLRGTKQSRAALQVTKRLLRTSQ